MKPKKHKTTLRWKKPLIIFHFLDRIFCFVTEGTEKKGIEKRKFIYTQGKYETEN